MNKITLTGRLTKDLELRKKEVKDKEESEKDYFAVGTLAVNNKGVDNGTSFFNFIVFGKKAISCAKYLKKGDLILISGECRIDIDKKEDIYYTNVRVNAEELEFLKVKYFEDKKEEPKGKSVIVEDIDNLPY